MIDSLKTSLKTKDELDKYFLKAMLLHVAILLLAYFFQFVLNWDIFNIHKDTTDVKIVQSAVRVDIVELPKYTLQELKKMDLEQGNVEEPEEVKPTKTNETSKVEFKEQSKKVDLSNLLNKYSSKKVKRVKKVEKKFDNAALKKLVLEGNKISKGSSATGENNAEIQQEFIAYIQGLPDKVRTHWKLPSYLIEKELQCRIQIFLGKDGKVIKMNVLETSGELEYDQKAKEAILKSSPLPRPSETILGKVTSGAVVLGFPL